mmetsp:Transcript_96874/g.273975  ORF Transcript_96874/g.273975 Transcript_96874/m.273975 type:complete len:256 (-) Transcript_96874:110-877(-)
MQIGCSLGRRRRRRCWACAGGGLLHAGEHVDDAPRAAARVHPHEVRAARAPSQRSAARAPRSPTSVLLPQQAGRRLRPLLARHAHPGQPEVGDLRVRHVLEAGHRLLEQHVQALQVAVHDLGRLPVQVGHGPGDVLCQLELLPQGQLVLGEVHHAEQRPPAAELQHQVEGRAAAAEAQQADQVRVLQARHHVELPHVDHVHHRVHRRPLESNLPAPPRAVEHLCSGPAADPLPHGKLVAMDQQLRTEGLHNEAQV